MAKERIVANSIHSLTQLVDLTLLLANTHEKQQCLERPAAKTSEDEQRRLKRQGKGGGGQFSTWVQDMLPKSQIFGRHIFLVKVGLFCPKVFAVKVMQKDQQQQSIENESRKNNLWTWLIKQWPMA